LHHPYQTDAVWIAGQVDFDRFRQRRQQRIVLAAPIDTRTKEHVPICRGETCSAIEQVVFGVLIIVFLIYEPLGMANLLKSVRQRVRSRMTPKPELPDQQIT